MAVKRKQTRSEIALRRLERVLHEAEGEIPRALMRMPDDAVKETERVKELRGALERLSEDNERYTVAVRSRNVSVEILERLIRDEDVGVRSGVGRDENLNPSKKKKEKLLSRAWRYFRRK